MKKLVSIVLVLVMVFAVAAVAASAKESPSAFFNVITASEGNGTASADKSKVDAKDSSDVVTLTATENGGYFTKWIMSGSYNAISGDEYSDVFVVRPTSDIVAVASFSAEDEYLTISGSADGEGTFSIAPEKVKKGSNETVTLTATPKEGFKFSTWVLECEYEIVSGSLTSEKLVIRPYTDIKVTAVFTKDGKIPPKYEQKASSDTSPKTGDPTLAIIAIVLLATFVGAYAVKKVKD